MEIAHRWKNGDVELRCRKRDSDNHYQIEAKSANGVWVDMMIGYIVADEIAKLAKER